MRGRAHREQTRVLERFSPQFREREQSNEGRWSTDRKRSARTSHNLGAQASQMPVQLRYLQDAAASSAVAVLHTTQA